MSCATTTCRAGRRFAETHQALGACGTHNAPHICTDASTSRSCFAARSRGISPRALLSRLWMALEELLLHGSTWWGSHEGARSPSIAWRRAAPACWQAPCQRLPLLYARAEPTESSLDTERLLPCSILPLLFEHRSRERWRSDGITLLISRV